jgi:hypothetical protein
MSAVNASSPRYAPLLDHARPLSDRRVTTGGNEWLLWGQIRPIAAACVNGKAAPILLKNYGLRGFAVADSLWSLRPE